VVFVCFRPHPPLSHRKKKSINLGTKACWKMHHFCHWSGKCRDQWLST
jgi:hypothetical protein